jgi:hypothetical protein
MPPSSKAAVIAPHSYRGALTTLKEVSIRFVRFKSKGNKVELKTAGNHAGRRWLLREPFIF